jgi:hypothetical protein
MYQIEFSKDNDKRYLFINLPENKLQEFLDHKLFNDECEKVKRLGYLPTGLVYILPTTNNTPKMQWSQLALSNSVLLGTKVLIKEIDILVDRAERFVQLAKQHEKNLKEYLENSGKEIMAGEQYGAYYCFTESTSPSYKTLWDMVKLLMKDNKEVLENLLAAEKNAKKPHKSNEKALSWFDLNRMNEKSKKVWKE